MRNEKRKIGIKTENRNQNKVENRNQNKERKNRNQDKTGKWNQDRTRKWKQAESLRSWKKYICPMDMEEDKDLHPKAEVPRDPDPDALGNRGAEESKKSQTEERNQEMEKNRDMEDTERKIDKENGNAGIQEEGSADGRVLSSTWQAIHTGLSKATSAVTKQAKGLCTLGRGDFGKPIGKEDFEEMVEEKLEDKGLEELRSLCEKERKERVAREDKLRREKDELELHLKELWKKWKAAEQATGVESWAEEVEKMNTSLRRNHLKKRKVESHRRRGKVKSQG